ncbi:DNA polymerase III subunit delta' C-terminal domain-containing protein [Buchnera aphidicola (Taiwanaphis decaspermi)]|uniref:DNA polymerase III subunit delta' C-terminal domain-containing protein n=1 Tax=Buchnera aphidicola TaxID=9 RepID=UPI0031B897AB
MSINNYPWLNEIYKNVIRQYKKNILHHAILIESFYKVKKKKLILEITKWLLCKKKKYYKSCNICANCKLVMSNNYPDLYLIKEKLDNLKKTGVNEIRKIINNIYYKPQYGKKKIVWLFKVSNMNKFQINSLLKVLEEPPKNTWFFISDIKNNKLLETFRSRCLVYTIIVPINISIKWLNKYTNYNNEQCFIAIKLNNNSPIDAKKEINNFLLEKRFFLYQKFLFSIKKNDFVSLFDHLNSKNVIQNILWICFLLLDVIKYKLNCLNFILNKDCKNIIYNISKIYSYRKVVEIINIFFKCRYNIINIPNINTELLIIDSLIKCEKF